MRMQRLYLPEGYQSPQNIIETEIAIKRLKDFFERSLSQQLNLTRVSAPLFVKRDSGLNDTLNGVERPVSFDVLDTGEHMEVVQSLAKWKRMALGTYGFQQGMGLYTDMDAIRRDEMLDNIHSVYVDQWDWEKIITKEERTVDYLKEIVEKIYEAFKDTEKHIAEFVPNYQKKLPEKIVFVTSEELLQKYPHLSVKERETAICREHKAVFLLQIGDKLSNGEPHDLRAPDYDDWTLNGDILFYFPVLDIGLELSSMGIRVDKEALLRQLELKNAMERTHLPFHKSLLEDQLPLTVGGGIGQSRLCMFFLDRAHIGEVQSSFWPAKMIEDCKRYGINLL